MAHHVGLILSDPHYDDELVRPRFRKNPHNDVQLSRYAERKHRTSPFIPATEYRAAGIRTRDLLNPIQAHYQAVLRPDLRRTIDQLLSNGERQPGDPTTKSSGLSLQLPAGGITVRAYVERWNRWPAECR